MVEGINKAVGKNVNSDRRSLEDGVKALDIAPTPPPPPKQKIDVLKAYKESSEKQNVNFVVVGHVDAGKSTLMGRILYDTGAVDERTLQKFRKEAEQIGKGSFALAWVLDQTQEERSRSNPLQKYLDPHANRTSQRCDSRYCGQQIRN